MNRPPSELTRVRQAISRVIKGVIGIPEGAIGAQQAISRKPNVVPSMRVVAFGLRDAAFGAMDGAFGLRGMTSRKPFGVNRATFAPNRATFTSSRKPNATFGMRVATTGMRVAAFGLREIPRRRRETPARRRLMAERMRRAAARARVTDFGSRRGENREAVLHGHKRGGDGGGEGGAFRFGFIHDLGHVGLGGFAVKAGLDLLGLVGLLGRDGFIHVLESVAKGIVQEISGEVNAFRELGGGIGIGGLAPDDLVVGIRGVLDDEAEAVQVLKEGDEGGAGAQGVITIGITADAEGILRAGDGEGVVLEAVNGVTGGGGGGLRAEVHAQSAEIAIQSHGAEKRIGHDEMPGPTGMHAVFAGDHVGTVRGRGIKGFGAVTGVEHRPENVGVAGVKTFGDGDVDVAKGAEIDIQLIPRELAGMGPARHLADATRRADDDLRPAVFESSDDGGVFFLIPFGILLVERTIMVIVHAVTERGDGGLEAETVIRHAVEEAFGRLTAPTKLAGGELELGNANGEISLEDARIHFLFGDRIADDGQRVAGLEDQGAGSGRFAGVELGEVGVGGFRFVIKRARDAGKVEQDGRSEKAGGAKEMATGIFHGFEMGDVS